MILYDRACSIGASCAREPIAGDLDAFIAPGQPAVAAPETNHR